MISSKNPNRAGGKKTTSFQKGPSKGSHTLPRRYAASEARRLSRVRVGFGDRWPPPTLTRRSSWSASWLRGRRPSGTLVAERLGWAFVDLDDLVIEDGAGQTVADIFAAEGETGFRRRESDALREAAERRQDGRRDWRRRGLPGREPRPRCWRPGTCVGSRSRPRRRSGAQGKASGRPLLDGAVDPVGAARELLDGRRAFYERAHVRVDTDGRSAERGRGRGVAGHRRDDRRRGDAEP